MSLSNISPITEKDIKSKVLYNAGGLITEKPSWLVSVTLGVTVGGNRGFKFYDGVSAAGRLKFLLRSGAAATKSLVLDEPMFFADGMFLLFSTLCYVSIEYVEKY